MEPKKNPKYDIHRKRGLIFNVSLVTSLVIVITAFRWSVPMPNDHGNPATVDTYGDAIPYVPATYDKPNETTTPKPLKKPVTSTPVFVEVTNDPAEEDPNKGIDQSTMIEVPFGSIEVPSETVLDTITFRVVEKMPEPVGGMEGFYNTLRKNLKYPKTAQRMGVAGKVFVEFTVNEKGALDNIRILKGIGYGCDEEAKRVLALTKWNAGKQRGRPVKVRMAQQITFSINR